MKTKLLFASLALNLILIIVIGVAALVVPGYLRAFLGKEPARKQSQFELLSARQADIVFLGDSLTDGGRWHELLNNPAIVNRGLGSDTTRTLAERLPSIYALKPRRVLIMIGINDLNDDVPIAEILQSYQLLFDDVARNLPDAEIIIQSLLPSNSDWPRDLNPGVRALNTALQAQAARRGWRYVDLHALFVDGRGELRHELSNDGVHLLAEGYDLWREALRELVNAPFPEHPRRVVQ